MKKVLLCVLVSMLVGCATTERVNTEVVVQKEYVVRTATQALKEMPPYPATINPKTATQTDLALWMLENEKFILALQAKIDELVKFYEKPVTAEQNNR
jgi:hypothetical protein